MSSPSSLLVTRSKRFGYGALAAVTGAVRALTDASLRHVFWRSLKHLVVASLVLMAVLYVLLKPVELVLSLFLAQETIENSVQAFRYAANSTIPLLLVGFCRYFNVKVFEDAFFAGIAARDAALAEQIRSKKAIYWDSEYVKHLAMFAVRQAGFGLLALLAAPLLGVLIPVIQFGYRIRHMETIFWLPVFAAFCFPGSRWMALQVVHLWMDSRAIIRELFDPIIARLKSVEKEGGGASAAAKAAAAASNDLRSDMEISGDEHERRKAHGEWHQGRSDAARLGFALVFGYLLEISVLGPFAWFLAFVSAGLFAPELIDLRAFAAKTT